MSKPSVKTYWKIAPQVKFYESLTAVADNRVVIESYNKGYILSSRLDKKYYIKYNATNSLISVDNNKWFERGNLGYPAIAFLISVGILESRAYEISLLENLIWKDVNQTFENDYNAALNWVLKDFSKADKLKLHDYTFSLRKNAIDLGLKPLII